LVNAEQEDEVSTYLVTAVRKEWSADGTHKHIAGVWVSDQLYSRAQVVNSINSGNTWKTSHGTYSATIHPVQYCRRAACRATPYIETNPNSTAADNLENLPDK